jgi:hypothetical protein
VTTGEGTSITIANIQEGEGGICKLKKRQCQGAVGETEDIQYTDGNGSKTCMSMQMVAVRYILHYTEI